MEDTMPDHPYRDCTPMGIALSLAMGRLAGVAPETQRPSAVPPFSATHAGRMEALARQQIAATLASAMIVASGRPHDLEETFAVFGTVLRRFWPKPV